MAVKTFQVSTEYDRQAAEARKRRRMADLLAQQVIEPTQYGPGPTPAAAPLVQGLQAFLAARAGRKADEAEETALEAKTRAEREAAQQVAATGSQIAGRLMGGAPVRDIAPPDASGLGEVAIESRYRKDPEGALAIGMTQRGGEAISKAPLLAAMLANQMKEPKEPKAPTVAGGMMWSAEQNKFVPIEGYAEQQERIARAKRPDVVVTGSGKAQPSASPTETGQFLTDEEAVKAGFAPGTVVRRRDGVVLQAPPQAQRVSQANKATAVNRVDQVASRLMQQMDNIKTGGVLGVTGALSRVFDSQDAKLFESYRQQLSAALRSALRIPGEGALSDYEQQLYGLQLPELGQSKENNIAIMQSLKEQVRLAAGQEADLDEGVVDLPPRR
jgi:hypothetical protein